MQVMRDHALAAVELTGIVGIGDQKFGCAPGGIAQHRARDGAVIVNPLALLVPSSRQAQLAVLLAQENESPFGVGQAQRRFQQGVQNVVQHADGVQLARRLQKDVQHFQIRARSTGRFPRGKLAQKLLRRAGGRAVRAEQHIRLALRAEFDAIIPRQLAAVDAFSVHERAVTAALVHYINAVRLPRELGMLARDARIGHNQVAVGPAADGVRIMIKHQGTTVGPFHHDQHQGIAGGGRLDFAYPHAGSAHQASLLLKINPVVAAMSLVHRPCGIHCCSP